MRIYEKELSKRVNLDELLEIYRKECDKNIRNVYEEKFMLEREKDIDKLKDQLKIALNWLHANPKIEYEVDMGEFDEFMNDERLDIE